MKRHHRFVLLAVVVLAIAIPDVPGGLDKLLAVFAETNLNIEYLYAFKYLYHFFLCIQKFC